MALKKFVRWNQWEKGALAEGPTLEDTELSVKNMVDVGNSKFTVGGQGVSREVGWVMRPRK